MDSGQHNDFEQSHVQQPAEQPMLQSQPPDRTGQSTSGLAVAGLVLGILAILGAFVPLLNFGAIPFALVGLALAIAGFVSIKNGKRSGRGIAVAGIVLGAVSLVVIIGMYGCAAVVTSSTSSSSSANATAQSSESASASATSSAALDTKRTTQGPLSFNLPKGWVKQAGSNGEPYYYPSASDHTSLIYAAREDASIPSGQSESEYLRGVVDNAFKAQGEVSAVEVSDVNISELPAKRAKASVALKDNRGTMTVQACFVYVPGNVYALMGGSMDGKLNDDIAACLDTLEVSAPASSPAVSSSAESASSSAQPVDGGAVSPELKEALDSYEAFMDEYIEFMKRYQESDDTTSMLNDYLDYMQQYSDLMAKINAVDTKKLSAVDAAYYVEVTSRVSKKLIEASL